MPAARDDSAPRSPEEAIELVARRLGAWSPGEERCPLELAMGRGLAAPVLADRDQPAFDHSAMDGYAVRLRDLRAGGVTLPVAVEARIGAKPPTLPEGAAARIATGAPIPPGADLVLRREDVAEARGRVPSDVAAITIPTDLAARARAGEHLRRRGENARAGDVVLEAGELLDGAAIGALASVGEVHPRVRRRLRAAILTTGDEVVPPQEVPSDFEIRDGNGPALAALLGSRRWIEVAERRRVRDEVDLLGESIAAAISTCDLLVVTGGVSVGHRDPTREAIERAGGEVLFHRLPQRPGRPMLAALASAGARKVPVFGLPGNPLSALVTTRRVVIPTIAAAAGIRIAASRQVEVAAVAPVEPIPLWWHRLARLDRAGRAELLDVRSSGDLVAGARSDGFLEVPPDERPSPGARYAFFPWDG